MRIRQNVKLAIRHARRSPAFTVVVVLTLGLGIGAATAVFSVAEAVLFKALPYDGPDRIVQLWEATEMEPGSTRELSWPDFIDLRNNEGTFERVGGYGYSGGFRIDNEDGPSRIDGTMVTVGFFAVLGVRPVVGRDFRAEEEAPGSSRVVMISHSYWQNRFGGNDVVGKTIRLEGMPVEIVGVLPADFHFAPVGSPDLWVAMVPSETQRERRYTHWLRPVARLRPDVSMDQARAAMNALARGFHESDPVRGATTISVVPISDQIVGNMRSIVISLLAAGGLVLLITIVNVVNLMMARSSARESEIATRVALGGTRGHIVSQFLTEGAFLGMLGVTAGMGLARLGTSLLIGSIPARILARMPYLHDVGVDAPVLVFAGLVTLVSAGLFGVVSAMHAVRLGRTAATHGDTRIVADGRVRGVLVALEVGLSLTLVVGSGLLLRSAAAVTAVDPGFDRHHLLTMRVELLESGYEEASQREAFFDRVVEEIGSRVGVVSAALVNKLPLSGFGNTGGPTLVGRPEPRERVSANVRGISEGYFETMGIPLVEGRAFSRDDTPDRPLVAVVSQSLANALLPHGSVVGEKMRFTFLDQDVEIVGVVGDENVGSLDARAEPMVYFAFRQDSGRSWYVVIRTDGDPGAVAPAIVKDVRELEPLALVHSVQSMDQLVDSSQALFLRRYPLRLIGVFSLVALVLAAIGVFGMVAYSVSLRTREFGIRLALGANGPKLFAHVMRRALVLAIVGVVIGLVLAVPLTRLLASLLFGVESMDPLTWLASAALLLFTAVAASLAPALRATRTDPAGALRQQ